MIRSICGWVENFDQRGSAYGARGLKLFYLEEFTSGNLVQIAGWHDALWHDNRDGGASRHTGLAGIIGTVGELYLGFSHLRQVRFR
jgi:hypothetical protein